MTDISAPDKAALLSRAYRAPLMAFFLRRSKNVVDAQDYTQEVLCRLVGHRDPGAIRSPEAYIFGMAAKVLQDAHRRAAVRSPSGDVERDPGYDITQSASSMAIDPERILSARQQVEQVREALHSMKKRTRDIFILHRIERMKQADIARSMGISVSAVEKHIVKASIHLAKRVQWP